MATRIVKTRLSPLVEEVSYKETDSYTASHRKRNNEDLNSIENNNKNSEVNRNNEMNINNNNNTLSDNSNNLKDCNIDDKIFEEKVLERKSCSYFEFILSLLLFSYISASYFIYVKYYLLSDFKNSAYQISEIAAFHIILIYLIICFVTTVCITPGKVNMTWQKSLSFDDKMRLCYCDHCYIYKPPFTHHCRRCNICITGMDHHCIWLNKCIGKDNRKSFTLFIISSLLIKLFILASLTTKIINIVTKSVIVKFSSYSLIVLYTTSFVICVYLLFFCAYHIKLILNNETTIERRNINKKIRKYTNTSVRTNSNQNEACGVPCLCVGDKTVNLNTSNANFYEDKNEEEESCYSNFTKVFGNNCLLWLVPCINHTNTENEIMLWEKLYRKNSTKNDNNNNIIEQEKPFIIEDNLKLRSISKEKNKENIKTIKDKAISNFNNENENKNAREDLIDNSIKHNDKNNNLNSSNNNTFTKRNIDKSLVSAY